jgi:4-hydroxybenzoate polyprenyltransferase
MARIVRPLNVLLTFGSVVLGGWLSVQQFPFELTLASIAAALIAAAGYVHNDIVDLPVDRISHPDRTLPRSKMPLRGAWILAISCCAAGFAISLLLPASCIIVSALTILLLAAYNLSFKRVPLLGNLVVAAVGGAPFIFGGLSVGSPARSLLPAVFAAIFHLGREILKDIQDQLGDRTVGARTLPLLTGVRASKAIVTIVLSVLVIGIPLPAFWEITGPLYLCLGLVLDALILLTICHMWGCQSENELEIPSRLLKLGMVVGISALLFDSLAGY